MNLAPGADGKYRSFLASRDDAQRPWFALAVALSILYACLIFVPRLASDLYATAGASTDAATHYYWSRDYFEALSKGVLLPSWASPTYGGLGSPVLYIYPPLFYFSVSLVAFAVRDIFVCIMLLLALANFVSGVLSFQMVRRLGYPALGLIAAFVVQFAPLAFVTDALFAAWPTYFAVPFILLFFYLSIYLPTDRFLHPGVALAAAALCFAHILTAFNVFLCTGIGCGICALANMKRAGMSREVVLGELRHVCGWACSVLLGVGIAALYVLPAVTSMSLFLPRSVDTSFPWYKAFLLSPVTGLYYGLYWPLVQVIVPGVALVFLALACWAYLRDPRRRDQSAQYRRTTCILLAIAVVSMFLATELSYPLWRYVYPIRMNLFPARLLQLGSLATMLVFLLLWWSRYQDAPRIRHAGIAAAIVIPTALTLALAVQFYAFDGKPRGAFYDAPASVAKRDQSGYYMPKDAAPAWRQYVARGGFEAECQQEGLACATLANEPHRKTWEIDAKSPATVELPLFWFPNWKITVNGVERDTRPAPGSGVIALDVSPGRHRVEATWEHGQRRMLGFAVSATACMVLLAGFIIWRRRPV